MLCCVFAQMIRTLPVALVELPLCLVNRLLLSDPQHTAPCLISAAQACAFLPYNTENSNNGTEHALNHSGNGVEKIRSNGHAKKTKIDQIKADQSKKRIDQLKGTPKTKKDSPKAQCQLSKSKTEKLLVAQAKTKRYQGIELLRDRLEQRSGCIEVLMDSLDLHDHSTGHLQDLSAQQESNLSWLIDSLEELRRSNECGRRIQPKVPTALEIPSPEAEGRMASSLLAVLLQSKLLYGCAVELLILLSQLAPYLTLHSRASLPVEATQLRLALHHQDDGIRGACCSLLGHLVSGESEFDPNRSLDPQIFQDLLSCLRDPAPSVRRSACKAVGNCLSLIGKTDLNTSRFKNTTESKKGAQEKWRRIPVLEGIRRGLPEGSSALKGKAGVGDIWKEVAIGAALPLVSLLSDADNVIRQHCCGALGKLAVIGGGDGALLGADAPCSLLQTACDDSHHAVRRAAVATLRVFSQQNTLLQVRAV